MRVYGATDGWFNATSNIVTIGTPWYATMGTTAATTTYVPPSAPPIQQASEPDDPLAWLTGRVDECVALATP